MGFWTDIMGGGNKKNLSQLVADGALLIDARTPQEFAGGTIKGSINIPHDIVHLKIAEHETDLDRPIVVYCQAGIRAKVAENMLRKAGYTCVENGGGIGTLQHQLKR